MNSICYLCNNKIEINDKNSRDHAVPRLLIERKQPIAKGFDYGGKIETHERCNNNFGPESYCRKALKIIAKLKDPECISTLVNERDPSLKIMVLKSDCFEEFTENELIFFKIRDVRNNTISEINDPEFVKNGETTNIKQTVLYTTFSVLVKSAAALLIKRVLKEVPSSWTVLAVPYHGVTKELNFNDILGEAKPFDKEVQIFIKALGGGVHLVLYIAYGVMLYLFFLTSEKNNYINEIAIKFPDADCYIFQGTCIKDLIDYQWGIIH